VNPMIPSLVPVAAIPAFCTTTISVQRSKRQRQDSRL
jgi:hypothetical protein